jgi:hypothetical protein
MRTIAYFLLGLNLLAAKEIRVELQVADQTGNPVPAAQCIVQFNKADSGKVEVVTGQTNADGAFKATANTLESLYVEVNKSGYYQARLYDISGSQDLNQVIKLPRKINPTALYVRHHTGNQSEGLKFPKNNQWYSYDLKVGDWVQPQGNGIVADVKMRLHCDKESLAQTYLELEAIDTSAGFHSVDEIISYSELKLPHQAPESNYAKTLVINGADWENYRGLFYRSRVQLDKDSKVISAHYGKIQGPITINRQGSVGMTHYFNGTPNDRNLEFDPSKNLLKCDNELGSPQFEP